MDRYGPTQIEWEWLLSRPGGWHIATTMLMGQTHDHLLTHDTIPGDDRTANLRAHLHAHRVPQEGE